MNVMDEVLTRLSAAVSEHGFAQLHLDHQHAGILPLLPDGSRSTVVTAHRTMVAAMEAASEAITAYEAAVYEATTTGAASPSLT